MAVVWVTPCSIYSKDQVAPPLTFLNRLFNHLSHLLWPASQSLEDLENWSGLPVVSRACSYFHFNSQVSDRDSHFHNWYWFSNSIAWLRDRLGHQLWVHASAPTFPSCVILGKLLNLYEHQFPNQENEGKSGIYFVVCLRRLIEMNCRKHFTQWLAHSEI